MGFGAGHVESKRLPDSPFGNPVITCLQGEPSKGADAIQAPGSRSDGACGKFHSLRKLTLIVAIPGIVQESIRAF
jgi:hypothetical protein